MPLDHNSVALVTASSAGLGAATARAFAATGVRVVINYNCSQEKADTIVKELEILDRAREIPSSGSSNIPADGLARYLAIQADVSKRESLVYLVEKTVAAMGRLDVVVSNQGWTRMRDFYNLDENVEESDWDRCFNMNVKSHLFLFHAAKEYLEETKGAFITTASLAGVVPSGSSVAYSVTKAAQIHLVKGLALTCGQVRVNSVSPGILLTDWGRQFPQAKMERVVEKSPMKRIATVEDVAQQILCLANSSSVTGTNSVIDAGFSL